MRLLIALAFCLFASFALQAQTTIGQAPIGAGKKGMSTPIINLKVDAKKNCLLENDEEFEKAVTTKLTKGTYVARVSSGKISFWSDMKRAQPFAFLRISGGTLKNVATEGETTTLYAGLEGYSDTFTFEVTSKSAKLDAFIMDNHLPDNQGSVVVTITKQ